MSKATTTSNEVAIATIVDVLRLRAETQRDEIAYRFLVDGEEERGTLTYGELYRRARQIAGELQRKSAVGQRALLLNSSESDYIITFFGCLCAGVIAVPIYAPRVNKKGNARVESVVVDAQPSVVLTTGAESPAVRDVIAASTGEQVKWIDTNALPVDGDELWTPPAVSGTDIAFLQYTSGSTAAPKGVMVSHANILHNERMIQNAFDTRPGSVIVGWLPLFHDMGLIGNVLQPLFAGVPCILMSPVAFLQRPLRWLQAISRYQATTSGGPNFAYEHCMRKIRPEDRSGIDLSSWRVAFNGAEPVRLETVNRFAVQFADCGFRREAFVPCYGLAEATLFVSGGLDPNGVTIVNYGATSNSNGGSGNGAKISRKQDKLLVACGHPPEEQTVRIVSPDSLRQCSAGDVGEIWVSGPSVAQGYWRKAKETAETFSARIPEIDEGMFLRTGDLGFLKDGHLFITGRLKDLLIIRGQNYYPQDIELTVEQSHPILQPGAGAAFSVEIEGEERLVVVQEVAVRKDPESIVQSDLDELDALINLVSRNIVAGHELQAFAIVLIRKATIPKTSSGKIQRHACRDAFLNRELYVLREWQERKQLEPVLPKPSNAELDGHVPYGLDSWVAQEIARIQGIDKERIDLHKPFAAYGLDSLAAIEFAHKLQTEFQIEVDVAEFFGDSTIAEIIQRATDTIGKRVSKRETEQPARYPLSYGQRALWFVHQTAPESAVYTIARVIRITTGVDVGALRLAFQALVDRHPCLRTIVIETAGEPVQQVAEKVEVSFEYFDARDWSQVELEKALVQQSQRPFSLTPGPLFRTALYARSEKEYLLHIAVHHLVADYWSLTLLLDEIGKLYQVPANKVETDLVPLEYSYADFVEWQREKLSGPAGERLRDYWKNELAGELPPLSLPADHIRPPVQTFRGASFPFNLDARLTEALKRFGEEQQATLFTTLLAAFQVLLYRLTSQKQVIVGCPIAGRSRAEFANIAGYFVNTVPLRADFQHRRTFTEFLSQVRNRVSKAFAHELYPFSLMVEQFGIVRDPAVPPIFQSAFAFQQTHGSRSEDFVRFALGQPQAQVTLGGLQLEHVAVEQRTAQFDLTLTVGEGPDGVVGAWEYSSDLFDHSTVVRWSENFKVLLQTIVKDPDCQVSQLPMLLVAQRTQIVEEFNRTQTNYAGRTCVHQEIAQQAMLTPDRIAVAFGAIALSYQQLEQRSNQVAHYLRKLGVGPDARVGVCLDRSIELVVFMLGVLKAGGAYVPLDTGYPTERLQYMAQDAQAPVVIVRKQHVEQFANLGVRLVCAEDEQGDIDRESVADVGVGLEDDNLAYVIYTSGSTGKPKGAMNTHRGLQNRLQWMQEKYQLTSDDRVLQKTPFSFDVSVWEFFWPLMVGARLVMAEPGRHQDPEYLGKTIEQQGVTTLHFVPSMLQAFLESGEAKRCGKLRRIICSGEALSAELARKCVEEIPAELHNLYGPTEAAIDVTYWPCRRETLAEGVAIGKPIANTQMYVLDAEYEPVPVGVEGEIYIAGVGLARGYWNRPDLTAERFIANPLSAGGGTRLYRTGDRGRWRRDGNLEYLGRFDNQVKLRGFRIELGEIEAKLSEHPGVRDAVVIVREDTPGDKRLAAYIVPDEIHARPLKQMARLNKAGDLIESKLYELPNGMLVKIQNKSETDFLYREIFEGEGYLRHGITLEANACVFDVGANIGMFSLFVAQRAPEATVYAFEPIPAVFADLRINMDLYVRHPRAFNSGLAGESGTVTFTWYRNDSVLSGRYADLEEESSTVKSFLKSQSESKDLSDEDLDRLLAERLSGERVECQLRTLSSVIAEEKIGRIDLLKIDVEKSELDVLEGIEDDDWEKIRQIVLEVHDSDGRLGVVKRMLEAHRYELHIEQDESLQTTNLYNIYARQTKNVPRAEETAISPLPVRVPTYFSPAQFITSLKNHLKTLLPEYMVPGAYVCLDRLPLTPNGKLDRKALPAPAADAYAAHAYEAPQGTTEATVAGIWAELLKIERVGRNDIFYDLGGHSLLATQAISRIRQVFRVEVPLRSFLEKPTVAALAFLVDKAAKTAIPPLRPVPREQPPRLSFAQERLWFLSRYELETSLYNVPVALRLRGALNVEALKAGLQEMVNRHEVLRTSFPEVGEKAIQRIAPEMEVPFVVSEIREDELDRVLREQARQSFDLATGPLIRTCLLQLGDQDHVLLMVMHHIVSDGWSLGIMLREFNVLYDAFSRGVASPLPPLPIQYADFSEWQREWLQGEVLERQLDYWRKQLAGHETLNFPTDRPHSAKPTLAGAMETSRLPKPLLSKLKLLSDQQGVTLFMTLLAGFEILLYRYTGQTDISVGSGIANRNRQELEPLIGFFVNTLVLRTEFSEDSSVAELLQRVRDVSLQAYAHQDIPFERLVEALDPVRELSRTPFFQALFVLQNAPLPKVSWNGLEATAFILETGTAKFDLTLSAREEDGELELSLEYRTELFNAERMKRLLRHYRTLLEQIVVSVDSRISELEILSQAERRQLLVEWNRTEALYPTDKCVHQLFEEQAAKTPQAVAVRDENGQIGYGELNRRANQLAHYLRKMGVVPDARVGICVERSFEMIVGLLAILKAGGAYVPLDPAYPAERLSYMLADSVPVVLLTQGHLAGLFPGISDTLPLLDLTDASAWSRQPQSNPQCAAIGLMPEHLAYVIYTSGSTGQPKGVAVEHRSLCNLIYWHWDAFALESGRRSSSLAGFGFDAATWEIWPTLCVGASLMLAPSARTSDPEALLAWWKNQNIDVSFLPTPMAEFAFTRGITNSFLHTLLIGGDRLRQFPLNIVPFSLVNNYGPTETTVVATSGRIEPYATALSIGRPIANTRIYVLDKCGGPVSVGVVGELYIGGAGVARGYLNRPELTAERFLADPFSPDAATRMYRTGDLGRWLADGNIEFVGRNDFQVKIRGFRIELGEIEAKLSEHPGVRDAVVIVREDTPGDKRLAAYVTTQSGDSLDIQALRTHLAAALPEYMVPGAYVCLDRLPLTPNGKLDRKALPAPAADAYAAHAYEAPQGTTEATVAGIWAELLKIERVGRNDIFYDLGGHSLLATQAISRIRQVFRVEVPLRSFLEKPTVAALAFLVDKAAKTAIPPLRPVPREQPPRLSFAQERLWFLSRYELETSLYNVPVALRLRGALNVEALKAGLQEMVNRHEVLRTSFPEVGEKAIQRIAPEMEVPFVVSEIREDELDRVLREQARQSFDLATGPLIRTCLLQLGDQDHVLLMVMHHIVSDGWSLGIMLREFNVLYDAFSRGVASPLPPLPIQYADFSEWQREWLQGEVLERQLDYWRKQLAGHETLNFPTDRPHSAKPTLAGAMETSRLPKPLLSKLKLLSDQQGVTLFMTLLAGFEILLYRYTGQTDISVGSGIANRNRQELEPLIGFFVNTLVLRTEFSEDSSVAELLQRVRDVSLQAYAHQDIPFERLVEALDPVRELSRTPFFQALFVLQNAPLPKVSWNGLEATAFILETGTAKFDLTLSAREEDGELELSLEYRTELFNAERMKRLLRHYRTLLEQIVVSVDSRISELEILSQAERRQLLVEWNRTEALYPTDKCVHQLFEEQAAKTPQAVAVRDENGQIGYGELNRRANQLAHYLRKMGVVPDARVGICLEPNLEMVVGLMGILKAGGACVPLDQADPATRRSYMVEDAGAKFVLTNERFAQQMAGCTEHVVDLEEAREEIERQSGDNLNVHVDSENLAWVIYTSSSTGRPKGKAIPHRSAVIMPQRALIDVIDQNPSVERWLNLYAPTEDTTYATYAEGKHDEPCAVTIGRSQSNTQAYILDGRMKLAPVGIKGELYLGGAGQARGYLNRPELTAEKFVPNPFSKTGGERFYRTGDLVRYRENGHLEFLGRLDSQVKIQGYRIEPGEIEAALLDYPGVTQAAAIAREDKPEDVRLVGYVAGSEKLDIDRLQSHLQQRLPECMVPVALLQLDTLPLTANGKVDRKALIELESKEAMEEVGSLTLTPTEELIAGVWSSLLGKSDIRCHDNFFDLGGHSLTSIQMLARLEQVFNREIELRAIFEFPVLKDFSAYVDRLTAPAPLATLRPIVPTSRDGDLPLSFAQQRLWFLAQMEGGNAAYHVPFGVHLKGDLNRTALRLALDRILVRHEVLRTTFAFRDGEPVQKIGSVEESSFGLLEHDLRGHKDVEAELAALGELETGASFDLEAGPLIRGRLIWLGEEEYVLLVTMHHIVSDGWSIGVLVRELNALYGAFLGGEADPLPELKIQYADYAVWQRQWIEGEILQQQAVYWKTTLAGAPALLALPMDRVRPVQQSYAGAALPVVLEEKLTSGLKGLSRRNGTTLYMTLLAGWAILLAWLSGQQDVVIGSPVANRRRGEIENLIGFFVNTLALRLDLSGSPSVRELLQQTKAQSLAAQRHQDIPFEQVVELAQPVRSLAHSPLFQIMFAWQNATDARLELPGLEVQPLPSASDRMAKFDLHLSLQEVGERIVGTLGYATALYERTTIERYREYFLRLVQAMVADDTQAVDHLRLLTEVECHQVLYEWNATEREYPRGKCVHELFEEQVRRSPEATAVVFDEEELSYEELNERANQLARRLRELGVGPEARVGLLVERSLEMVVGLLGVLKAGAAYVPLDPDYPSERLSYMLESAQVKVLLTQERLREQRPPYSGPVIELDGAEERRRIAEQKRGNLDVALMPEHLAYIIYTSGSTGRPKGVMNSHGGLLNRLLWMQEEYRLEPGDAVLQKTPFSFDVSVWEFLWPLLEGAKLVVARPGGHQDPDYLATLIQERQITTLHFVPSMLAVFLDEERPKQCQSIRRVVCSGEALPAELAQRCLASLPWAELHNLYGPTEAAIDVTYWKCLAEDTRASVPIGKAIANIRLYVVDEAMNPVPLGVPAELCLGGIGLARGYWSRGDLTAERFVPDGLSGRMGERLYRTGDLVRWLEDGNLEYLGRLDQQVKIRGFRIELGEIEAALRSDARVQDAVVTVEGEGEEKRLLAYVVAGTEEPEQDSQKTEFIEDWLQVWEGLYGEGRDAAGDSNLTGWQSSYSGEMIPVGEMRTWIEETVSQLRGLNSRRVLEVGCGTGLLLTRLAANCESYIGIDFSQEVLRQLKGYLSSRPDLSHVQLRGGMAHELSFLGDDSVDLVILNSVVQYFPGTDYLLQVLEQAIRVTKKGGHIFVGDVRNLALQEAYQASVQLYKAGADLTLAELRRLMQQGKRKEEELLIDAELFAELGRSWKKVGRVKRGLKRGDYDNELSRFRYDVVLEIGEKEEIEAPDRWVDWDEDGVWRVRLEEILVLRPESGVGVRGIRDARTAWVVEAVRLIEGEASDVSNAAQLKELCEKISGEGPNVVMQWAEHLGVEYCWRGFGKDGIYEAIFNPRWQRREIQTETPPQSYRRFGNSPARNMAERGLGQVLRDSLRSKLPEYMVPATVMVLEAWPLTPNGKLDRKALRAPEQEAYAVRGYEAPVGEMETKLAEVWAEVLKLEKVGRHDNFFDLGGHSLLAVRVVSRLQQIKSAFAIEMPLSVIFVAPTVARMAKEIVALNGHEQPQSSPVLVNIQPQGSRAPFFCVHAVGGQVISYAELSRELGLGQPFYGLQSPPAKYFRESGVSVEQLATFYNQEIRSVQPCGPYLLSGWSMGGLVAWEMAQQLIKEGEIVSLLALIDTAPPPKYWEADDRADEISMLARFALDMSRLVGKDPRPLMEEFLQAAEQDQWKMLQETLTSYGVLAPKTAHAEMTALLDVFTRNFRAMNNYSIHTSKQAVVYFRASETPERFSRLWTEWSRGGIQFHSVPGDHFTMLRRPNVRIIAETLQRYLSRKRNNESRAVSPEISPRELIGIENQRTR